ACVLELAILGLLKDQELHGYELKKRLAETLGPFSSVSFGSLYPALARLETAGAVKAVEASTAPVAPIPTTGSLTGEVAAFRARRGATRGSRGKKVYGITERGEELFEELLAAESQAGGDDDRAFPLELAFSRYPPPPAPLCPLPAPRPPPRPARATAGAPGRTSRSGPRLGARWPRAPRLLRQRADGT